MGNGRRRKNVPNTAVEGKGENKVFRGEEGGWGEEGGESSSPRRRKGGYGTHTVGDPWSRIGSYLPGLVQRTRH